MFCTRMEDAGRDPSAFVKIVLLSSTDLFSACVSGRDGGCTRGRNPEASQLCQFVHMNINSCVLRWEPQFRKISVSSSKVSAARR